MSSGGDANANNNNDKSGNKGSSGSNNKEEKKTNNIDVHKKYQFRRTLGKGASCRVVEAIDKEDKETKLAIKIMSKEKAICTTLYKHEVDILGRIQHDNIVKFIDGTEDDSNYYVLTGLCEGGELFGMISCIIFIIKRDFATKIYFLYRSYRKS